MRTLRVLFLTAGLLGPALGRAEAPPDIQTFLDLGSSDAKIAAAAELVVAASWSDGYASMLIDMARLLPGPTRPDDLTQIVPDGTSEFASPSPPLSAGSPVRARILRFLERQTRQKFGNDLAQWRQWMWQRPYQPHPDYASFKAAVYARVDPAMRRFFTSNRAAIRLDEIDWGGVKVNGIPPLVQPTVVAASRADWLKDDHWVFGVAINGEARAYPKRILAWHEMARDRLGGVDITLVYCTLCGTAIPYESRVGGVLRTFGTSGLLFRSNKLMFDEESGSLWSTLEGRPVVGPLAGTTAALTVRPIVTTRWSEWRRAHPSTTVLSLDTGFVRDYAEGAAYRDYFSNDRLMFRTPFNDRRLANKDEVLGVLIPAAGGGRHAVAFAVSRLARESLVTTQVEDRALVVVTSASGANRVYDAGPTIFVSRRDDNTLVDAGRNVWRLTEDELIPPTAAAGVARPRVPAFRAFWFGWHAQFPDTLLIK